MELRKITVVVSNTNSTVTFQSGAETLGQLKQALSEHNISYEDQDIYEGLSKSEFKVDASDTRRLPQNVMYKGNTTNELVFYITNTNKKIKSGIMTRNEAYKIIKEHNLSTAIANTYGKNFTNLSTEILINYVSNCNECSTDTIAPIPTTSHINNTHKKNITIIDILRALANEEDSKVINDMIDELESVTPSYSQDELTSMFSHIRK